MVAEVKKPRKINNDFFEVGYSNQSTAEVLAREEENENRDENWRNIKPTQNVDALNKEVFKKRKYEEY